MPGCLGPSSVAGVPYTKAAGGFLWVVCPATHTSNPKGCTGRVVWGLRRSLTRPHGHKWRRIDSQTWWGRPTKWKGMLITSFPPEHPRVCRGGVRQGVALLFISAPWVDPSPLPPPPPLYPLPPPLPLL